MKTTGPNVVIVKSENESEDVVLTNIRKESQQLKEINDWSAPRGLLPVPYDVLWAKLYYTRNSAFAATVNQIATDVAGLGWRILQKEDKSEKPAEKAKIKEFLDNCSPSCSLRAFFQDLLVDWGVFGFFGIEVIRNNAGEVSELIRIPAETIRVHKSGKKYCQVRSLKKVWFKRFGEEEDISAETGEPTDNLEKRANEIIFYRNPNILSENYGVPNVISADVKVKGSIESDIYNASFFENGGVVNSIITFEGEWDPNDIGTFKKFFTTELTGSGNAHKHLFIRVPADGKINIKELTKEVKDSSFQNYQKDNKEAILSVYSMPPERIGISVTGTLGGEKVKEANFIYKNSTVEPLQNEVEYLINRLILPTLKVENYNFMFVDLDLTDSKEETERLTKLVDRGIISRNEARKELGRPPVDGGDALTVSGMTEEIGVVEEEEG